MSSTRLLRARLKRFRESGEVALFEPTPLDVIDERHHDGQPFFEPALYIPGELLIRPDARSEAEELLRGRGDAYRIRDTGPGGLTRVQVEGVYTPRLALEIEASLRGSTGSSSYAQAMSPEQTEGSSEDEAIRRALDETGRLEDDSTLVSLNHCFTPTPVCGVGPADEPRPAEPIYAPEGSAGLGVRVAIVDTGIFKDTSQHPWLATDVHFTCSDIEPPDRDGDGIIDPVSGHGHFVAGIVRTAAPGATIFVERLFHRRTFIDEFELNTKLHEVLDGDPDIINLSLTAGTWNEGPPAGLMDVWAKLRNKDPEIVVVASAGNAGVSTPFWPAAQPEVLSVGAVNDNFELPPHPNDFSNYGPWVKVYARGVDVVNAFTTGTLNYEDPAMMGSSSATFPHPFCSWSGTSFSAPLVTGRIAARMTRNQPTISAAAARDAVLNDARSSGTSSSGDPERTAPDGSPMYIVE